MVMLPWPQSACSMVCVVITRAVWCWGMTGVVHALALHYYSGPDVVARKKDNGSGAHGCQTLLPVPSVLTCKASSITVHLAGGAPILDRDPAAGAYLAQGAAVVLDLTQACCCGGRW